uniref:Uncharacterized protein n=1 Tax=Lygus hesperus TaxID=30085 RepID=A0A146MF20_LYGHE
MREVRQEHTLYHKTQGSRNSKLVTPCGSNYYEGGALAPMNHLARIRPFPVLSYTGRQTVLTKVSGVRQRTQMNLKKASSVGESHSQLFHVTKLKMLQCYGPIVGSTERLSSSQLVPQVGGEMAVIVRQELLSRLLGHFQDLVLDFWRAGFGQAAQLAHLCLVEVDVLFGVIVQVFVGSEESVPRQVIPFPFFPLNFINLLPQMERLLRLLQFLGRYELVKLLPCSRAIEHLRYICGPYVDV